MTLKQTMCVKSRLILSAACLLLLFSAGLASAQCEPGSFCDGDSDGFFRDHKRCRDCLGERDCDDSDPDPTNTCDGGTSVAYTAELTKGAFVFRDGSGEPVALNVFPAEEGNRLLSAETVYMLRPDGPGAPRDTSWDNAFLEVCPGLGGVPEDILAAPDSWSILGYGGVRVSLRDYRLEVPGGEAWEVWIQLIGNEDVGPLLPDVGEQNVFALPWVSLWGKPADKKGRKSDCIGGPLPQELLHPSESELTIRACLPDGNGCASTAQCCSSNCSGGTCQPPL